MMKSTLVLFVLSVFLCSIVRANEDDTVPLAFIEPKDGSIHYHSHPLRIHLHAANSLKVPVQVSITCPNQPIHSQVLRTEQVAVIALPPELRGDVCEVSVSQVAYPLSAPEPVFVAIIDEDWAMELMQEPSIEDSHAALIEEEHSKVRFVQEPIVEPITIVQVNEPITLAQVNEPIEVPAIEKTQQSPYLQPRPQIHLNNPVQMQQLTQQLNQVGQTVQYGQAPFVQPVQQKQVQQQQIQQQRQVQHTPIQQQRQVQQMPMQQQMPRQQQYNQPRQMPPSQPQQYQSRPQQYIPQQANTPPVFQYHHQNQFGGGFAPSIDQLTPINPWTDPAADPNTDAALDSLIADMERKSRGGERPQWQGISRNEFARMDDESFGSSSSVLGLGGKFRIEGVAQDEYNPGRQEQIRKSRRSRRSVPAPGRKSVNVARKSEKKSINTLLNTLSHQPHSNPFARRSRKSSSKTANINSVISVNKPAKSVTKSVTKQRKEKTKAGRNNAAGRKSQRRRQ